MNKRDDGENVPGTSSFRPDIGKEAQRPVGSKNTESPATDSERPNTSGSGGRQSYWTSDRYGWVLIVNGEKRARVEGPKIIILTHGDAKARRLVAPDAKVPFDIAERLLGIPKVDRFEDRGLRITSPRSMRERATTAFCQEVPKDRELRHYLSEA
ncbi:hypothetical protein [Mesorhizobium temperatum]|uniref:Uncharacterized protein n=1 Tax=Mesorhizobium temperatum TaxID=241416 RepID=A0A271LU82_9HYPH|nr:hypothetical protein [Mesorhizobium temperatum]PAQ11722.1 hypothetical protein CIT26_03400 [Mesorhizobium temperatum]